ncbi:hypothetical protein SNE40_000680 [Patella caerulea]|uniref:Zinc finger CCCH-type with G patch domain-containing protein n=1 Tax=Patella caerulea TaxID=87958 RepID=A0AAN8Q1V2_PATCE
MDEESLKNSIELYKSQLNQVEQAIEAAGETDDMVKLKDDLKELIALTEDSLLSLLKGQLLQSIESTSTTTTTTIDDEYAAFQEALGEDTTKNDSTNHDTDNKIPGEDNSIDESLEESLLELQGMRCRAPFQHDWGCLAYYNALIHSVDPVSHNTQCPMVNVMFCNPTHSSMALCPFYLEGRCKFSDDECRNSHGYPVKIEDLQEYQEPNYSLVKIDTKCLAQYEDGLWYKATVIDMKDQKIQVLFDEYGDKTSIGLERILPIDNGDDISDDESELDDDLNKPLDRSDSEDDDALPVFLWKPPKTTAKLGEWEEHTKGIGSKLMIKMGYIIGQGLGKNGDGKAEPVPIQLIPKGKSLDKIMELKEIAGDQDLFDAMKKLKKKTKKTEDKNRQPKQTSQPTDMFDFINKKLRGKKGERHCFF